jgi:hypothetical protein
LKELN